MMHGYDVRESVGISLDLVIQLLYSIIYFIIKYVKTKDFLEIWRMQYSIGTQD